MQTYGTQSVEFKSQYTDMSGVVQNTQSQNYYLSMTVKTSEYTQNQNPDTVSERIAVTSVKNSNISDDQDSTL